MKVAVATLLLATLGAALPQSDPSSEAPGLRSQGDAAPPREQQTASADCNARNGKGKKPWVHAKGEFEPNDGKSKYYEQCDELLDSKTATEDEIKAICGTAGFCQGWLYLANRPHLKEKYCYRNVGQCMDDHEGPSKP